MAILLPKYEGFTQERKIGDYTITLPDPPSISKIANYRAPKEKQKFIPEWYSDAEMRSWDAEKRSAFEGREWDRRRNGFWFYNNGKIEYLTGTNYLYVAWWKIDIGLPQFVDSDQHFFYLWKYIEDNPIARGLVYVDRRRGGKTWKSTCVMYDGISQTPSALGSIQSKSDTDAKKVFEKLIFAWRKAPYFFKPVDVGESHPKSKLEFTEPGKRDTKKIEKSYGLVLDSVIDYTNAKEVALDGTKQYRCLQDEAGKTDPGECDIDERISVVKECVMDGTKIVGKILVTTTVEEMESKGGKQFKKIVDKTDPNKLMPNGETENGLLRYLNPAYYGFRGKDEEGIPFVDEYGYSDQDRAKKYLDARLNAIRKSEDKNSERRKYAQTWRDCFIVDGKKAVYDTARIEQQLEHNETLPLESLLVRGDFQWVGGIKDTTVEWMPKKEGKWLVAWMPKSDQWNKKVIKLGKIAPGNIEVGCFGLDPYDNKVTVDDRKSDAASYGGRKFDPLDPYNSGILVTKYVNRPRLPEIMWEDMILQAVFYGWEILIESNKIGTINHFRVRGYENYLMDRPEETQTDFSSKAQIEKGIPMSGEEARLSLIYATQSYIGHKVGLIEEDGQEPYMGKCYFNEWLEQCRDFDFDQKWTKFDSMVGAGLCFLGMRKALPRKYDTDAKQFFEMYKVNGVTSQRITKENNDTPPGIVIRDM